MKQLLKDNFALVVGISLPLILMILFFLAGRISQETVADPQYDAVFAVDYYENANAPYSISVDNGNINIKVKEIDADNKPYYQNPRLYLFDHETLGVRQLDIDFDTVTEGRVSDPDLAALNENDILPAPVSPDGYKFEYRYHGSSGLFGELFGFGYRHRSNYVLQKDTRTIPVNGTAQFYNAHFIGWVQP